MIQYRHLIFTVLAMIVIIWVLYAFRIIVLPFAIGLGLAYITQPLVAWLERHLPPRKKWMRFKRVFSIGIVFLLVFIVVAGFLYIVFLTITGASAELVVNAPALFHRIQQWATDIISRLPAEIQQVVNQEINKAGTSLGAGVHNAVLAFISSILRAYNVIIGFALLPFFLFYLLRHLEYLKKSMSTSLPASVAYHARNIITILEMVLGRYIKAEGTLGFIVGFFTFIGLLLLKVPYPLALALVAGIGEMIPSSGRG